MFIRLIFISDGAAWLGCWIEFAYPGSDSILYDYHASEFLPAFVREHFKEEELKTKWITGQERRRMEGLVKQVVKNERRLKIGCQ